MTRRVMAILLGLFFLGATSRAADAASRRSRLVGSFFAWLTWLFRRGCPHAITLYNATQANKFARVRVTAIGPATKITVASGGGWTQVANYPTSVEWAPPTGFVPIGTPIPNAFNIRVAQNNMPGKRVLFEWLDTDRRPVCSQLLATPCLSEEPIDTERPEGISGCLCVNAVIAADPVSLELVEPDIDADIDAPVRLSRTQYKFVNISEVEPLSTPVQTQWIVTKHNALDEEQVVTPPMAFDGGGNPTIDFPAPGRYTVYLHMTAPNCSEEEIDTAFKTVEITELNADFNWEQTYCTPNQIQFTDASEADSKTPIVSWLWELYELDGTTVLSTQTLQTFNYTYATYPTGAQVYKICLTVTNSLGDTDKVCKDISFSDACKAEFQWNYKGCDPQGPFTVHFINKSVVASCPAAVVWNFGDPGSSTDSSSVFGPSHIYNSPGTYWVTLKMTDAQATTCTAMHQVTVQPCWVDFRMTPCPDCSMIFDIIAPDPTWSFKWSFPSGIPDKSEAANVKVKYPGSGTYKATLTVTTPNFCTCTILREVDITSADCNCCARNDRQKDDYDFDHGGKEYRMKYKLVQVNLPLLHYVKGKTKLKKKNGNGIYRAAKASEIQVKWDGMIYKSKSAGDAGDCHCAIEQAVSQNRHRTNKTKSKKVDYIGFEFRTRKNSLTATHYVKVDSNHAGVTQTVMLGKDCD